MKPKRPCYLYQNQEFIGKFESIKEAAMAARETPTTAQNVLTGKSKSSKKGFVYSFKELSQTEVMELPVKIREDGKEVKHGNNCYKEFGKQRLEVECDNMMVFAFERSRKGKINQLKEFIYSKLYTRWLTIPKELANMEKEFVKEILESLEN